MKIDEKTSLLEIIQKYPKSIKVFEKYNLHCAWCPMAQIENISDIAKIYGIDIKKLLKELNKAIKK